LFEDMLRRVPSIEKLERLTSFRPKTELPEIVDRVASLSDAKATRWDHGLPRWRGECLVLMEGVRNLGCRCLEVCQRPFLRK